MSESLSSSSSFCIFTDILLENNFHVTQKKQTVIFLKLHVTDVPLEGYYIIKTSVNLGYDDDDDDDNIDDIKLYFAYKRIWKINTCLKNIWF
jgi:hypothetical protein